MGQKNATHYYLRECQPNDFRLDGMRRIVLPRLKNKTVLELGIGTGHLTRELNKRGYNVTAVDIDQDLMDELGREMPAVTFMKADLNQPNTLPQGHFPSIVALDILEHLEQDERALQSMHSVQKTGDQLLILVPLFQRLYSHHDKAVGHVRRYSPRDLLEKIDRAGYEVVWQRRWNAPGLIANGLRPGAGTKIKDGELVLSNAIKEGPIARALGWWLSEVESRVSLGFGLSMIVDARRRA
jgi:SAM-dependent methyltransferase